MDGGMGCYRGMTGGEVNKLWTLLNVCMDWLGGMEGWEGDRKGNFSSMKNASMRDCMHVCSVHG
jgi:hypothetical protein